MNANCQDRIEDQTTGQAHRFADMIADGSASDSSNFRRNLCVETVNEKESLKPLVKLITSSHWPGVAIIANGTCNHYASPATLARRRPRTGDSEERDEMNEEKQKQIELIKLKGSIDGLAESIRHNIGMLESIVFKEVHKKEEPFGALPAKIKKAESIIDEIKLVHSEFSSLWKQYQPILVESCKPKNKVGRPKKTK